LTKVLNKFRDIFEIIPLKWITKRKAKMVVKLTSTNENFKQISYNLKHCGILQSTRQ
jgi:hypothetical protein